MPDFFLPITSFSGCGCQPRKPSVRSFKISWNLPPAQITASSGTPSSLRRPSGRPHSVPSSWLALARWGCCPEWDRALPEKQLEGGEREREGQETGLAEGGGGQLRGAGSGDRQGRLPPPASGGPGLWVVAGGEACWGRPAAGSGAHHPSTNQERMEAPGSPAAPYKGPRS